MFLNNKFIFKGVKPARRKVQQPGNDYRRCYNKVCVPVATGPDPRRSKQSDAFVERTSSLLSHLIFEKNRFYAYFKSVSAKQYRAYSSCMI